MNSNIKYQRMIKGNLQHIGNQYDYFLFTYIPERQAWIFTTYFSISGHIIDPITLKNDKWKEKLILEEASRIANSLYMESGLWVL